MKVYGGVEIFLPYLISALDGSEWSSVAFHFYSRYPLDGKLDGSRVTLDMVLRIPGSF
jgi:hypothetical protein